MLILLHERRAREEFTARAEIDVGEGAGQALASRVPNAVRLRVAEQAQRNRLYLVTPVLPTPQSLARGFTLPAVPPAHSLAFSA